MSPLILLFPLDTLEFLALDLAGLLDNCRNMSVSGDASNLRHMGESFGQSLVILESLSLSGGLDALAFGGVCTPDADVAVVRAGENVFCVRGPFGCHDALHTLGVVDVAGVAAVTVP